MVLSCARMLELGVVAGDEETTLVLRDVAGFDSSLWFVQIRSWVAVSCGWSDKLWLFGVNPVARSFAEHRSGWRCTSILWTKYCLLSSRIRHASIIDKFIVCTVVSASGGVGGHG